MNLVGEKIEVEELKKGTRRFVDVNETLRWIKRDVRKFICWGATAFTIDKDERGEIYFLRFFVSGMKHTGHIYIVVNGNDTFRIYYTSNKGTIRHIHDEIYVDMLNEVIDNKIEKQANYKY